VATQLLRLPTCNQQTPQSISALPPIPARSQWDQQKSELLGAGTDWTHALADSTETTDRQRYWRAVRLQWLRCIPQQKKAPRFTHTRGETFS